MWAQLEQTQELLLSRDVWLAFWGRLASLLRIPDKGGEGAEKLREMAREMALSRYVSISLRWCVCVSVCLCLLSCVYLCVSVFVCLCLCLSLSVAVGVCVSVFVSVTGTVTIHVTVSLPILHI